MGKPGGFMEFKRQPSHTVPPLERIKNYNEFHALLPEAERKKQAGRCMECGVPFCQAGVNYGTGFSGCPLHNLIPEWNDMVYKDNTRHALDRLLKTNNFPEFTGRVCPALCEAGCTCGLNGEPVTVRDNELGIIESAYANGDMHAQPPQIRSGKKVAVVGSGPAGLAAADTLNKRGHSVHVFERDDRIGGLLMYGIPNMKLDKRIVQRRTDLMQAEGVRFITSCHVGQDIAASQLLADYDAVILCCGARQPRDLPVPGRDAQGVHFAVPYLSAVTKALLDGTEAPISAQGLDVVVVGGGDTGNDCVATAIRQGCRSVTQLEMMPKLPDERQADNPWPQWPRVCKTDYGQEEAIAVFGQDPRRYCTTVKQLLQDEQGCLSGVQTIQLHFDDKGRMCEVEGSEQLLPAQLLLIAAGFTGSETSMAQNFGAALDARNNVRTTGYRTEQEKLFAAGDVRRGQSLVVWAIAEGRAVAREVDTYLMGYSELR